MVVVVVERRHAVAVRLSPSEYERWREAATAAGRGQLAAWVRDHVEACLAAPADDQAQTPAPVVGVGVGLLPVKQALEQLARVGNLLNQSVRLSNSGAMDPPVAMRLVEQVAAARKALVAVSTALAGRP